MLEQRQAVSAGCRRRSDNSCKAWGLIAHEGAQLISLFAYENAGLASWLDVLAADAHATHLLVPEGRILGDVQRWLGVEALAVGRYSCTSVP